MSGPYLESGESIVLTTDRVSLDQTVYTAMLTNRQLILLDSDHGLHEPRTIALATVFSVRSGNAATGEPVISITCERPDGKETTTSILHFLQAPLENRKHDRDHWVKKIIEHSLSGRAVEVEDEPLPSARVDRPVLRRNGPEITRPRIENFPQPQPSPDAAVTLEETVHLAQPEGPSATPPPVETAGVPGPVWPVLDIPETGEQEAGQPDVGATEPSEPSGDAPPSVPAQKTGDGAMGGGTLAAAILRAVQSLTARSPSGNEEKRAGTPAEAGEPQELPVRRTTSLPEYPAESRQASVDADTSPTPSDITPRETTLDPSTSREEIGVSSPTISPDVPVTEEITAGEETAALPEPAPEAGTPLAPAGHREPSSAIESNGTGDTPGPGGEPPGSRSSGTTRGRRHAVLVAAIIVLLLLGIAAILVLPGLQQQGLPAKTVVTPTPAVTTPPVPTGTVTPRPTTMETPTPAPATEVTPVPPTLARSDVPQTGVWVRVTSPAAYSGQAGNPGYLRQFTGPGEKFISTYRPEGLVQVSVRKHDFTDAELLVEIFRDGALVISRSTTSPGGSVDLLIDPKTGSPPGLPPVRTITPA